MFDLSKFFRTDRDGLDNGKIVASSDLWMPLPTAP
jgi:hypothetical protein